jgi:hypothetical protein
MPKFFIFDTEGQSIDDICRIIREVYENEKHLVETPKNQSAVSKPPQHPAPKEKLFVSAAEMAKILKVPLSWIYQRTMRGKNGIPHFRLGKYLRFDPNEVVEYFKTAR